MHCETTAGILSPPSPLVTTRFHIKKFTVCTHVSHDCHNKQRLLPLHCSGQTNKSKTDAYNKTYYDINPLTCLFYLIRLYTRRYKVKILYLQSIFSSLRSQSC